MVRPRWSIRRSGKSREVSELKGQSARDPAFGDDRPVGDHQHSPGLELAAPRRVSQGPKTGGVDRGGICPSWWAAGGNLRDPANAARA